MTSVEKRKSETFCTVSAFPHFHLEADAQGAKISLFAEGILGIGELSEENICLITLKERIKITGKILKISVFQQKKIKISGKIENISFLRERGK